jgi:tetratricopeptide (TPR) repeat protein
MWTKISPWSRVGGIVSVSILALASLLPAMPPQGQSSSQLAQAKAAEEHGQLEEAARLYRAILATAGSSSEARLGLGRSLAGLGRCDEAAQTLHGSTGPAARAGTAEDLLGVCYFRVRNYEKAILQLEQATRRAPKAKDPAIYLSRAYAAEGRRDKATAVLRSWLGRNGDDVDVLYWIGKFYEELAEITFDRMAAANPNSYLIYQLEAEQDITKKAYKKATEALERALALAPNAPGLHYWLGRVYWYQRILDKAQEELEKELRTNPYHAQANYLMGDVLVTLREPAKAIPYLERAVALNPGIWDAHRALGRAYVMQNKLEEGIREFRIVADANPTDDTIHGLLSNAYRRLGNNAMAQEEGKIYQKLNAERRERVPKPTIEESHDSPN